MHSETKWFLFCRRAFGICVA